MVSSTVGACAAAPEATKHSEAVDRRGIHKGCSSPWTGVPVPRPTEENPRDPHPVQPKVREIRVPSTENNPRDPRPIQPEKSAIRVPVDAERSHSKRSATIKSIRVAPSSRDERRTGGDRDEQQRHDGQRYGIQCADAKEQGGQVARRRHRCRDPRVTPAAVVARLLTSTRLGACVLHRVAAILDADFELDSSWPANNVTPCKPTPVRSSASRAKRPATPGQDALPAIPDASTNSCERSVQERQIGIDGGERGPTRSAPGRLGGPAAARILMFTPVPSGRLGFPPIARAGCRPSAWCRRAPWRRRRRRPRRTTALPSVTWPNAFPVRKELSGEAWSTTATRRTPAESSAVKSQPAAIRMA